MIVLDTNVISEIMRPVPHRRVLTWLDAQPISQLATTAITIAEIFYGLALLADGQRRQSLTKRFREFAIRGFDDRILSFDLSAAEAYAPIILSRRAMGRPISQFDAQIAAITQSHGASLATRNSKNFADLAIDVINPWTSN